MKNSLTSPLIISLLASVPLSAQQVGEPVTGPGGSAIPNPIAEWGQLRFPVGSPEYLRVFGDGMGGFVPWVDPDTESCVTAELTGAATGNTVQGSGSNYFICQRGWDQNYSYSTTTFTMGETSDTGYTSGSHVFLDRMTVALSFAPDTQVALDSFYFEIESPSFTPGEINGPENWELHMWTGTNSDGSGATHQGIVGSGTVGTWSVTGPPNGTTVDLSGSTWGAGGHTVGSVTEYVWFQWYGHGGDLDNEGALMVAIDDVGLYGAVVCAPVPEPSVPSLFVGILGLALFRRSR